jgi:hypothetical protein
MRKPFVTSALVLAIVAAGPAFADDCEHSRVIDLTSAADGVDLAVIMAGAGALLVEGGTGTEVVVAGRACASDANRLANMNVNVARRGERLEIETDIPEISGWSWSGGRYAYIDLEVRVPAGMDVEVDDGSGSLVVRNVANLHLEDGSGNITVTGVRGNLSIDDNSGNIEIDDVAGEVWLNDGSGNITVRNTGTVVVDDDGSGNIDVSGVKGSVTVHEDGSGSIRVTAVDGDFTVRSDGSGGIRHADIGGTVNIPKQR